MRLEELPHLIGHAEGYFSGMRLYLVAGLVLAVVTFFGVVVLAARAAAARRRDAGEQEMPEDPAREAIARASARGALLTPGEMLFFRMLRPLVSPRCLVFAKVRLADLFEVGKGHGRQGAFRMLSGKRIDFVLCDPSTSDVVAGVEMDENAADGPEREEHERFIDDLFSSNGLPLFRVPMGASGHLDELREFLASHELLPVRAVAASEPVGMI